MANSIAYTRNYTAVLDEVYKHTTSSKHPLPSSLSSHVLPTWRPC